MKNSNKKVKDLTELVKIQGEQPSVKTDEYMLGLYNGLEVALATIENREAKIRSHS